MTVLKKYLTPLIVFFYIKKIDIIFKVVFGYCLETKRTKTIKTKIYFVEETDRDRDI